MWGLDNFRVRMGTERLRRRLLKEFGWEMIVIWIWVVVVNKEMGKDLSCEKFFWNFINRGKYKEENYNFL